MANIILEGHNCYNVSIPKKDIYPPAYKEKYYCRILIDVKSEICCPQIQFVSYESKPAYWTKDELLTAFNIAHEYIKLLVETDRHINIFDENEFYLENKELQIDEMKNDFQIEIPENKENAKILSDTLLLIKESQDNFKKCKDKLFRVIDWGPDLINRYRYNINSVINYLYSVTNAGVVTSYNNEKIDIIKSAFNELGKRKNPNHYNYKTTLNIAQKDIYILEFPKFFKTNLPKNEISKVLEEIR